MQPVASRELPADQAAYAFEPKWDGYRALIHVRRGRPVRLVSRQGAEMRGWFPELTGPGGLAGREAVLDGEVVALTAAGRPSFGALQDRARRRPATAPSTALALMVFDLLWLDGRLHLTDPYTLRRELLEGLVLPDRWQLVQAFPGTDDGGSALLAATRDHGLEGVVAKRLTSPYRPGRRSRSWLKIKHYDRAPFVVGGWIPDAAGTVAALLVGCYPTGTAGHRHERLRLAARVDTGLSPAERGLLTQRLVPLASTANPFSSTPAQLATAGWGPHPSPDLIRFVRPELVVEVQAGPWDGGRLRHPRYSGLVPGDPASLRCPP
jgi:bifunctional non-homologous end joining protein LigD